MHRSGYLQGAGVISTSDAKLGELFLKGVDAFCFCNLIWDDVPQARAVGEDSALVCQSRRVWYAELGIAVSSGNSSSTAVPILEGHQDHITL